MACGRVRGGPIAAVALLGLVLAGCGSTKTVAIPVETGSLIGKPVTALIMRIGAPHSGFKRMGQTVHIWRSDHGSVCSLRVFAYDDNIIRSWDLAGSSIRDDGCERFVAAMR